MAAMRMIYHGWARNVGICEPIILCRNIAFTKRKSGNFNNRAQRFSLKPLMTSALGSMLATIARWLTIYLAHHCRTRVHGDGSCSTAIGLQQQSGVKSGCCAPRRFAAKQQHISYSKC